MLLCVGMFLVGCSKEKPTPVENENSIAISPNQPESTKDTSVSSVQQEYHVGDVTKDYSKKVDPDDFYALNEPELLNYLKDNVYNELLNDLPTNKFFVENVDSVYVSKEYIEELNYNSKENVFFGYTLSELDNKFKGKRYVFTLGDDGQTTVKEFEEYSDDTYSRALKNVAVGSGVILLCVTVSTLTASAAPAASVILAVSAKSAGAMAISGGSIGAISTGILTGITTGDMEEALKAAANTGSKSFKWGALSGALAGGATEAVGLFGATANQLTMNQAAMIQRETKWPLDVIKNLHSMEEYDVYRRAGLVPIKIDNKWSFIQNIDWNYVDENGLTNLQRVLEKGNAPIGPDGKSFQLHHIGQRADSPLAILTYTQHHTPGDYSFIHYLETGKDISDAAWAAQKREFWERVANTYLEVKGLS